MTARAPDATAHGTLRLLWDGPVLYVLVEVAGDSTRSDSATPNWNRGSYAPESDGLFVFMDAFNDHHDSDRAVTERFWPTSRKAESRTHRRATAATQPTSGNIQK